MDNIPEFSLSLNLLEEIHRLYPSFILPLNLHKEQGESDFLEDDYEDYPLEEPSTNRAFLAYPFCGLCFQARNSLCILRLSIILQLFAT